MRRIVLVFTAFAVMAAFGKTGFALGEGSGGKGYPASAAGGSGRASSDGLTSTGFSIGVRAGGIGIAGVTATSHASGGSTDDSYQSTGLGIQLVRGKGPSTDLSSRGKGYFIPIVRGIGATSASPGGRGL